MGDVYLFMDPSGNGNGIASGLDSASGNGALYYTTNFGVDWYPSNIDGTIDNQTTFSSLFLSGNYAIAGSVGEYNNFYNGIYYSTNAGQTWTQSNINTVLIQYVYMNGPYAIATTLYNGVYYSSNNGKTWSVSNLVLSSYGACITATSSENYYAVVATSNGLYYSTGNSSTPVGSSWTPVSGTKGIQFIAVAASNDTNNLQYIIATSSSQYGLTSNLGIWSSMNFGQNFKQVVSGIALTNLAFSGQYALASSEITKGLYSSSDYGQSWVISEDPNANSYFASMSLVGETALLYSLSPYIQIYYTTNYGQNLSPLLSSTLELQGLTSLVTDGTNLHGCIVDITQTPSGQIQQNAFYSSNPTVGSTWAASTIHYTATSSAQGTAYITSSVCCASESHSNNSLVSSTCTATATGSGTGPTYDKALENAAKASLRSVVEALYEAARKTAPGPIVSSALVTGTKEPSA